MMVELEGTTRNSGLLTLGSEPVPSGYRADGRLLGAVPLDILLRSIQNDIENHIRMENNRYE
jgi:hypothetical protein